MLKALMMDVDGVLVRGRPEDGRHWSASLEADLGLRPDVLHSEFFKMYWEDIVLGRIPLENSLSPVLRKIAPHLSPEQFIAYWFERDARIDHGLLKELSIIRSSGLPIYLATNQEHRRAQHLMQNLGLAEYVDGIHYSAQLGMRKPSRDFFDTVASKIGLPENTLLLVDDTLDNVTAATAAGWQAVHWTPGMSLIEMLRGL